jgi:hypothetical protein
MSRTEILRLFKNKILQPNGVRIRFMDLWILVLCFKQLCLHSSSQCCGAVAAKALNIFFLSGVGARTKSK